MVTETETADYYVAESQILSACSEVAEVGVPGINLVVYPDGKIYYM